MSGTTTETASCGITTGDQRPSLAELIAGFEYLDDLRDSGRVNMFGAAAYLAAECGVERNMSRTIVKDWMETFDPDASPAERARAAISKAEGRS